MNSVGSWIKALRLRTLPLSLSGIVVGSVCAFNAGFWNTSVFLLALSTTVLFQILSNLANDLGDTLKGADNSERVGPMRSVQSGEISKKAMKRAILLLIILSMISAGALIYLGTQRLSANIMYSYVLLAASCVLAAITYTMGKHAYGYLGLGDLFVFLFFGIVSVLGVYPLFANTLDTHLIYPAITIGSMSTLVLNLNNMRDHENDEKVGKRTLVVKLGFQQAKMYHLSLVILAFASWGFHVYLQQKWWYLITLIPFIVLFRHILFVFKTKEPRLLDSQLKIVALNTFLLAILFSATSIALYLFNQAIIND